MIDRKDDNFGKRMIPEPDLNYLQQVIKNNPDPQDVGRGTAVTYDAGEGIKIPDNKTIEIDTDVVALKEDIPTVGNGIITIQVNGETVDSFGVNRSTNKTVNIPVQTGEPYFTIEFPFIPAQITEGTGMDYELTEAEYNQLLKFPLILYQNTGNGYSQLSGTYLMNRMANGTTVRIFYHDAYSSTSATEPSTRTKILLRHDYIATGDPVDPTKRYAYGIRIIYSA